jgi:hypothetical protein
MRAECFYDRDGEPMPWTEWQERFSDVAYSHVAMDVIDGAEVSTVWLGMSFEDPPLIFETMVFGGSLDSQCWRWPTRGAAVSGHDQIVAALRDGAAARP